MTDISTLATKTPEGWYFVQVIDAVPPGQWFNINHAIRLLANSKGTTIIFTDGSTMQVSDPLPQPVVLPLPSPPAPEPEEPI